MIIEYYGGQNLEGLRQEVILLFKELGKHSSRFEEKIFSNLDYGSWHPERPNEYNDTWKIITYLEGRGYHSYFYDTVLYTSTFEFYKHGQTTLTKITGDGLSFNQAVCNMFIKYALSEK